MLAARTGKVPSHRRLLPFSDSPTRTSQYSDLLAPGDDRDKFRLELDAERLVALAGVAREVAAVTTAGSSNASGSTGRGTTVDAVVTVTAAATWSVACGARTSAQRHIELDWLRLTFSRVAFQLAQVKVYAAVTGGTYKESLCGGVWSGFQQENGPSGGKGGGGWP